MAGQEAVLAPSLPFNCSRSVTIIMCVSWGEVKECENEAAAKMLSAECSTLLECVEQTIPIRSAVAMQCHFA
jgi:hypothetical protein